MLARFRKHLALLTLLTVLFFAAFPSAAESFTLDFSAYPAGTSINNVDIPGVRFFVPNGTSVTVDTMAHLDINTAGAGTDLVITFSNSYASLSLLSEGYGSCQHGPDMISLYHHGELVDSLSIYETPQGRCDTSLYTYSGLFNEIHIDVDTDEAMYINSILVDTAAAQFEFQDGRINAYDMGGPVVLYPVDYGDEDWGLHVYAADGSGLLWEIRPDDIPAECPSSNTLIAENSAHGLQLYRLAADGEGECSFQLIAPTSEAGKFYYIIFDTLGLNSSYQSWEE